MQRMSVAMFQTQTCHCVQCSILAAVINCCAGPQLAMLLSAGTAAHLGAEQLLHTTNDGFEVMRVFVNHSLGMQLRLLCKSVLLVQQCC